MTSPLLFIVLIEEKILRNERRRFSGVRVLVIGRSMASKVTLKSSEGGFFEVETLVAMQSEMIKSVIESVDGDGHIPLYNVSSAIVSKVLEYCEKHAMDAAKLDGDDGKKVENEELKSWDAEYIAVDLDTLFDLMMAANYLRISGLLGLCSQTVANKIKGKSPEEIRKIFNIKNDFPPGEEEKIRSKHSWAFD